MRGISQDFIRAKNYPNERDNFLTDWNDNQLNIKSKGGLAGWLQSLMDY